MLKNATTAETAENPNRIEIELTNVIETIEGERTRVLVLRKPSAADFVRMTTMPVEINLAKEEFEPKFNPPAMTELLSRLSGQPPVVIGRLHPADWYSAAWAMVPFFVPGMPTS